MNYKYKHIDQIHHPGPPPTSTYSNLRPIIVPGKEEIYQGAEYLAVLTVDWFV